MAKSRISRSMCVVIEIAFLSIYFSLVEAGNFVNPTTPGYRYYSQEFKGDKHSGIDTTGKSRGLIEDKPAFAAKDGKVIYADWQTYYDHDKKPETPPIPLKGQALGSGLQYCNLGNGFQ